MCFSPQATSQNGNAALSAPSTIASRHVPRIWLHAAPGPLDVAR